MLGSTYYHSLTRKYISVFGGLFNDIFVTRVDYEKNRIQTIPVPIRYASKQRWFELLNDNSQTKKFAISLPAISFQIGAPFYDPSRQVSPLNKWTRTVNSDSSRRYSTFSGVPYKLPFELTIWGKNTDDVCQIYEQILPYFTPDHVNTVTLIPEIEDKTDIKFTLTSISTDDTFEGTFNGDSRYIRWTLSFEASVYFIGPVSKKGAIKRVIFNYYSSLDNPSRDERTITQPGLTADGKPTTDINESIPYQDIQKEDDYGFIEQTFTFNDGKIYDPNTGRDLDG